MPSVTTSQRDMGIYIHIPFCHNKCIYCDFPAYPNLEAYHQDYVDALVKEIALRADGSPVSTIYFGGGTPTILSVRDIEGIMEAIRSHFQVQEDAEISIESNPGDYKREELKALRDVGFNRISFGVQTFDNEALALLGRAHKAETAYQNIAMAAALGFEGINLDLIYALPGQSLKDVRHNIEVAASLPINHISMYGLQLEEGTRLMSLVESGSIQLPDPDQADAMYDAMVEGLAAKGFERYEISNFARSGHYSQHNLKYWTYQPYFGFGAGASSFVQGQRIANAPNVVRYIGALKEGHMPPRELESIDSQRGPEDFCFLGLRTQWGIQIEAFEQQFGQSLASQFGPVIDRLLDEGLLKEVPGGYALSDQGAKHGNYVFEQFIRN